MYVCMYVCMYGYASLFRFYFLHSCVGVSIGRRSAWEDTEVAALQVVSKRRAEALPEDHPRIFAERSICTFILCKSAGTHVVYVCLYVCMYVLRDYFHWYHSR